MKDALGKSLEEIFRIVPGGCLVFFPSYKLMEKLCNRWCETGQWSQLNAKKSLSVGKTSLFFLDLSMPLSPCFLILECANIHLEIVRKNVESVCSL